MATEVAEGKVDLVAKEIELTKLLASNDPKIRSDGIKKIKKLLLAHSGNTSGAFELSDYMIIWRGLFYFMWMSDKPLPQENATEKISNLFHSCTSHEGKVLFLEAFFLTIKDDWMSISQHRIDKFMMLVRRCLRQVLQTFVDCDWDLDYLNKFSEVLYRALKSFTLSLRNHLQEIFLEELAKVSKGKVPSEALMIILDAFLRYISELNDFLLIKEVIQNVFRNLLSQSPDLEMLEAKFEAWKKMGKPGNSYNDLELVEGDIADDDSNEKYNGPLDPRAGNVNVEIPRIRFNPKDVAKLLNKYVTEVDCTRKCLMEISKLLKWYNRLGDGILPYKPKDLKLKSQVLKRKKKKHLSKMVKEGVKKLEMIDSKIKKSSREVIDNHKSMKELNKLGELIVEHGKIGKSVWKVRKFEESDALKENFSLNGSWTVSEETKNNEENKSLDVNNDEVPLLVPIGFNVEETNDKTPTKIQNDTSTPSLKALTTDSSKKDSNSNKRKNTKSKFADGPNNNNSLNIKLNNSLNTSLNNSWSVSINNDGSASKKTQNMNKSAVEEKHTTISLDEPDTTITNISSNVTNKINTPNSQASSNKKKSKANLSTEKSNNPVIQSPGSNEIKSNKVTQSKSPKTGNCSPSDIFLKKIKRHSGEINDDSSLNESWSVCSDDKLTSNKQSPKLKAFNESITFAKNNIQNVKSPGKNVSSNISIKSPNAINTSLNSSWSVSVDNEGSASNKNKNVGKNEKLISSSPATTPDKNIKSPKSPKSPTPEQRVLRRRTIIIPKKKPDTPNEGTPKRKAAKSNLEKKELLKRRKTIAGEEISMLRPEEISNKALEKVRSEVFEDGFDSPRKSSRLSIKTDSAKKRVEFQLKNNVAQEFVEYETTLVTKPENPHNASKQPVQSVLKLTPDVNRINPFYKFSESSAKKKSRKSIV